MGDVTMNNNHSDNARNSGGPLFDKDGNIIAINTARMDPNSMENVSTL